MTDSMLIIEDESLLAIELRRHFERQDWDVTIAPDIATARRLLVDKALGPLVVIADMNLPDGNALDLLESLDSGIRRGEWIILTAYGTIPDSVRAVRVGAFDFLEKPHDDARLDMVVNGAARSARAQLRLADHASKQAGQYSPEHFIGHSAAAQQTRAMLTELAAAPISAIVIEGETGTGKGLAARILHYSGDRATGPLVEVNCAAIPRELLESELFGHEAGSFTGAKDRRRGLFEQANGGSLFLDEIAEMDPDLQSKLLKAIEDQSIRRVGGGKPIPVDVRIITASNKDLLAEVEAGRLRPDLYHRISVVVLTLPKLRDRLDDIEDLVRVFIEDFNRAAGKHVSRVPQQVLETLRSYHWPGNVRELRNVIERCVLLSSGDELPSRWLQIAPATNHARSEPLVDGDRISLPLDGSIPLDAMEKRIIETALDRAQYNVTAAARLLGITRQTLRYRIEKHGLREFVKAGT
jgi:DNA-binding NtrC family response regulator